MHFAPNRHNCSIPYLVALSTKRPYTASSSSLSGSFGLPGAMCAESVQTMQKKIGTCAPPKPSNEVCKRDPNLGGCTHGLHHSLSTIDLERLEIYKGNHDMRLVLISYMPCHKHKLGFGPSKNSQCKLVHIHTGLLCTPSISESRAPQGSSQGCQKGRGVAGSRPIWVTPQPTVGYSFRDFGPLSTRFRPG